MFIDNESTSLYFIIINKYKKLLHEKKNNDGWQQHHIIPKSLGGSDDPDNLVYLPYKDHKRVHRLLIDMTKGEARQKMSYAYSWFGDSAGEYKTGKDNNFAQPEIIEMVRKRMKENNPMKRPEQIERMRNTNWRNNSCIVNGIEYPSQSAAARALGITNYQLRRDYLGYYQ